MTFDSLRRIRQRYHRPGARVWRAETKEEQKVIANFLRLCASKLTINDQDSFNQKDMNRVVKELENGKITLDDLNKKSGDELYDYIIGQGRLFE